MSSHKFRIGQMVDFVPSQRRLAPSARSYKILSLLPSEGGQRLYRIKTITEACDRVARESDLCPPLVRTSTPTLFEFGKSSMVIRPAASTSDVGIVGNSLIPISGTPDNRRQ